MKQPNADQMQALRDYATAVGPNWKARLRTDWIRAGTSVPEVQGRYHLLQQVRNEFGPTWLARVNLNATTKPE